MESTLPNLPSLMAIIIPLLCGLCATVGVGIGWALGKNQRHAHAPEHAVTSRDTFAWLSLTRLLSVPLIAWAIGASSRFARPYMDLNGLHLDAVLALGALALISVGLFFTHARHGARGHHKAYQLEALTLWSGFASGWTFMHGKAWDDLLGLSIGAWFTNMVLGVIVFAIVRRFR